jgi:pheromone shutdown-related protein TraB
MSETITRMNLGDREIILLGTAHVSRESIEDARRLIREEKPDEVYIEIDAARHRSLTEKRSWENLNLTQVLKSGRGFFLLANLALSSFQKKLGADLGVSPGEEMVAAIREAEELGIPYTFCDRDIQITLRRAWGRSGFWGKNKILAVMLSSVFSNEKLDEAEIEKLKQKNAMQSMLEELAEFLPSVKEVLIDERDRYIASRIFKGRSKKSLAVIGAGHTEGIVSNLQALQEGTLGSELDSLETLPPKGRVAKLLPYLVPVIILGLFAAGFFRSGWSLSLTMIWKWILVNGTLSALGALAALAHPLTIAASFVAAPITSMNPTIGVGIFSGLIELALRKPRVADFENLPGDLLSVRGFFKNRITHILLVFFFSSLGSAIGTFIGIPYLTSLLR